jgi:hypothetical protein
MLEELPWLKSSYTNDKTVACVELAPSGELILMRDSKDKDGPRLGFTKAELAAFIAGAKDCEFDHLVV